MKKQIQFLAVLLIVIFGISCEPNDDKTASNSDNSFSQNFGNAVSRDFIGQIVDENNLPLQGVRVKIGASNVLTDVNGVFIINGANVHSRFAYITAQKAGFIDGSRAMIPTSGKNNVKIMLISNSPVQTVQSGIASEVVLPNGTKVNFDGAFQDENGAAYSGSVQVTMYHLEASNDNLSSLMPGMLYAQDTNGDEKVLETFGMMNVELKGASGQKLQIASGHTAQITMAIDNTQLATAPSSIPLWHFDEVNGYWKEEGSAQKVGNKYVGTVSHFSWWNCDTFSSTVSLTVTVVDANGNPLPNVGVSLTVNATNFNSYIQTVNSNGQVSGLVPTNQTLTLNVYDLCGNIVYSSQIGPFSSDGAVTVETSINPAVVTSVVGNLVKCNGSKVTNGYVKLTNGNKTLIYNVADGAFSFQTVICNSNNNFNLVGFDLDDMQTTDVLNYTFTPINTNIGDIPVCNGTAEFISYKVNNDPTIYIFDNIQVQQNIGWNFNQMFTVNFQIYAEDNEPGISILGNNASVGDYFLPNTALYFSKLVSPNTYTRMTFNGFVSGATLNVKINKFGEVGDYIDVSFHGLENDQFGQPIEISGVAHVIRDN